MSILIFDLIPLKMTLECIASETDALSTRTFAQLLQQI